MTLLAPSLITPSTSKLFSYLSFSSNSNKPNVSNKSPERPTCITIVMRKDGTPTTKCSNSLSQPPTRPTTLLTRRRRSSFSSSQCLSSPPKQRRLMISSLIPRFHVSSRKSSSSLHSYTSSYSVNRQTVGDQTAMITADSSSSQSKSHGILFFFFYIFIHIDLVTNQKKKDSKEKFLHLPLELVMKILLLLDYKSLLNLAQTCKQFNKLCSRNHHYLWQTLFQTDYSFKRINHRPVTVPFYDLYKNHRELKRRWKHGHVNTHYLTGHDDSVYCLVWVGPNLIVSGSRDRTIKLWNLERKQSSSLVLTKTHHEGSVLCLRVSLDMTFLVSGSSDATCLIWSLPDFVPQQRLVGHSGGVLDVCVVNNYIISSSRDATIRIWDRKGGQEVRRLVGHAGPVNALASHEGLVVSASGDTCLKLWDIETGNCLRTFVGHTRGLACVRFDGTFIYSGGQDNKLKVWDAASGKCLSTLSGHSDLIRTIDSFEVLLFV